MSHRPYRPRRAAVFLVGLSVMMPGCAGEPDEHGGTLPPLSPTASVTATAATATSNASTSEVETANIRAVYLGFLRSYVRAQRVSPPLRKTYLAQWLAEPRLSAAVKSLAYDDRHYIRTVGADRPHIVAIEQNGKLATVEDCLDRTHIYIVDSRTDREINGGRGPGRFWVMTKLKKTASGWRVYSASHKPKRCDY